MKLKDILLIISSSVILTSCNYLDVVPSEIPQLSDAFKNEATAQNYIMGNVYGYIPTESSIAENPALLSTDELDIPWRNDKTNFKAYHINLGTLDAVSINGRIFTVPSSIPAFFSTSAMYAETS